jgi:hemolysin III
MTRDPDLYPDYTLAERIADGTVHGFGVTLAITGGVLLLVFASATGNGGLIAGLAVYAAALMATFIMSACYHMTPWERVRPILRRLDHAAIYFKIAGTYTPFVVMIGSVFGYVILSLIWALALAGALAKVFFWRAPGRLGTALYLVLGWLSLALVWPMVETLPVAAVILVGTGGVLYSLGVIFFTRENMRYSNAIWHVFVLAASGCFFAAISLGAFSSVA